MTTPNYYNYNHSEKIYKTQIATINLQGMITVRHRQLTLSTKTNTDVLLVATQRFYARSMSGENINESQELENKTRKQRSPKGQDVNRGNAITPEDARLLRVPLGGGGRSR